MCEQECVSEECDGFPAMMCDVMCVMDFLQ